MTSIHLSPSSFLNEVLLVIRQRLRLQTVEAVAPSLSQQRTQTVCLAALGPHILLAEWTQVGDGLCLYNQLQERRTCEKGKMGIPTLGSSAPWPLLLSPLVRETPTEEKITSLPEEEKGCVSGRGAYVGLVLDKMKSNTYSTLHNVLPISKPTGCILMQLIGLN